MKILFLKHKTIKDIFSHSQDEINLFGQHLSQMGIPYEFSYKDFGDELEWQQYSQGQIKSLSVDFMKRIAEREFNKDDYSVVFYVYAPAEQGSKGIFTSYNWFDVNGAIASCIPLTESDAKRNDQWLWRMFWHEFVHTLYGQLIQKYKINIIDIQDSSYHNLRKTIKDKYQREPTEDEYTNLSDTIYKTFLKPYFDKIFSDNTIKKLMLEVIRLQNIVVRLLKQKLGKSVVDRLAERIAKFEGFYHFGTLAYRNNNPGNLIWSPFMKDTRDGFAYFESIEEGWKALRYQLQLIFDGQSAYYQPSMNIQEFVDTWASTSPKVERENYAQYIASEFEVGVNTKLNELT